tara:strand:+ start:171 stop:461 length:291 start_codon:yes stop_codon:yes gene_type:complete
MGIQSGVRRQGSARQEQELAMTDNAAKTEASSKLKQRFGNGFTVGIGTYLDAARTSQSKIDVNNKNRKRTIFAGSGNQVNAFKRTLGGSGNNKLGG